MNKNKLTIILVLILAGTVGSLSYHYYSAKSASKDIGSGRLVGYWTMDTNDMSPTGATLYDKSGFNNTGTVTGTTTSTGKIGQARSFNGTSDFINAGNNAVLNPTSGLTLSAWAKISNTNTGFILARDDNALGRSYAMGYHNAGGSVYLEINGAGKLAGCGAVTVGQWYHYAVSMDPSAGVIGYLNGIQCENAAWTTPNVTTGATTIGRRTYSGVEQPFTGSIDDVRIYNRALSAAEVANLYNAAKINYVR